MLENHWFGTLSQLLFTVTLLKIMSTFISLRVHNLGRKTKFCIKFFNTGPYPLLNAPIQFNAI